MPLVLALGGLWFSLQEKRYKLQIADQRAQTERDIAEQRALDATLQAYLDPMTTLLLTNGLRTSRAEDKVWAVARARTVTALRMLDKDRRIAVLPYRIAPCRR